MIKKLSLSIILLSTFNTALYAANAVPRWYSAEQQAQGAAIFKQNCSSCHGNKAQATPNWKQTNDAGQYPPPPLNGSAHAWHHSLDILRTSVRDGGVKIGGLMPSFEKRLSVKDRDNAIAFFQSQWSDELYTKWSKNFNVAPLKKMAATKDNSANPIVKFLTRRLNSPNIDSVKPIAEKQLYEVKTQGKTIYLTNDGRYAVIGNLIDLKTGANLTKAAE